MTMRERVLLKLHDPDYNWATATELSQLLKVSLPSLSGLLSKMCKEGVLERFEGCGPRGGYGYSLPRIAK